MPGQTGSEGTAAFTGAGGSFPTLTQCFGGITGGETVVMRGYFLRPQNVTVPVGNKLFLKTVFKNAEGFDLEVPPANVITGQVEGGAFPGVQSLPPLNGASDPDVWVQSDIEVIAPDETEQVCFIVIYQDETPTDLPVFASNICGGTQDGGCDLEVTAFGTDPTGPGATDGTATAEVSGGTAPFDFEWKDDMGMVIGNTPTVTGLGAGTYTVTVTDSDFCQASDSVTLSDEGECNVEVRIRKACQCDKDAPCYEAFVTKGRTSVHTKFDYVWEPTGIQGRITCHPVPGENTVIVTRLEDGCEAAASFTYKPPRCEKK
jgi:hypothetical protein